MKTFGKLILIGLAVLLVLALVSCNAQEDSTALREQTESMIDGLIAGDKEACRALLSSHIPAEEFDAAFDPMCELLAGCTGYELKQTAWNTHLQNGVTQTRVEFLMTTDEGLFVITVAEVSDAPGLSTFYITPYENIVEANAYTGTLTTLSGTTPVQWVFLLIGLATLAFWVWAIVDCARHTVIKKSWWMVAIILGGLTWMVTAANGSIHFNVNYGFVFSYTAMLVYASGAMVIRFMIPVGAVIYAIRRKTLFLRAEEAAALANVPAEAPLQEPTEEAPVVDEAKESPAPVEGEDGQ